MILDETQEQRDLELSELIEMDLADVRALKISAPESIRIHDGKQKINTEKEMISLYQNFRHLKFPAYLRTLMKTSVKNRHPELIQLLRTTIQKRCLDFGCGVGTHAIAMLQNKNSVTILDVDKSPLLEFTMKRMKRRDLRCNIFHHTKDLPTKFYDVVVCSDTLEHVFDPIRELDKITQSMRTSAILHLQVSDMIKESSGHFAKSIVAWRKYGNTYLKRAFQKIGKTIYRKK